jgi:hypothetical protein
LEKISSLVGYMSSRRNLNGIPHNVVRSFFGTERYYKKGYMADWLLNAARTLKIAKASLDVLTGRFYPDQLNFQPLNYHAGQLVDIIKMEVETNGFPAHFITQATITFKFPNPAIYRTTFYCFPLLIDCEGREYTTNRMIESAWEPPFDPFSL